MLRLTLEVGNQIHMEVIAQIYLCFIHGFSSVLRTVFSLQCYRFPQCYSSVLLCA